jgi:hypothetical protein
MGSRKEENKIRKERKKSWISRFYFYFLFFKDINLLKIFIAKVKQK